MFEKNFTYNLTVLCKDDKIIKKLGRKDEKMKFYNTINKM